MNWWQVTGLVLIIEAFLPFVSPLHYRTMVTQIGSLPDGLLRRLAFVVLIAGAGLMWIGR